MALAGATKMNLILTMAGRYSRFINEGYKIPKYLLPWGKRSILSEILSIMNHNNTFENIYVIVFWPIPFEFTDCFKCGGVVIYCRDQFE